MSHYSSSPRTYMKSRSIVTVWTHEAHIISWTIVCCCPYSALHAYCRRADEHNCIKLCLHEGCRYFFLLLFCQNNWRKDQGMKKAHRSRWFCCYVESASWPSVYLLGWIIFLSKSYIFIYWLIHVQVHMHAYTL